MTCLLDEPGPPPFVTSGGAAAGSHNANHGAHGDGAAAPGGRGGAGPGGGGGRIPAEVVLSWLDGRDWSEGVPVPQQLLDGCPAEVFAFLQEPAPTLASEPRP